MNSTENLKPYLSETLNRIPAQCLIDYQKLLPNPKTFNNNSKVFVPTFITDQLTHIGDPKFPKNWEQYSEKITFSIKELNGQKKWVFAGEVVMNHAEALAPTQKLQGLANLINDAIAYITESNKIDDDEKEALIAKLTDIQL